MKSQNNTLYFFNENHSWGGGEKMFMWLASSLYKRGYDIKYCLLYNNDDISTNGVPADYLGFKFTTSYLLRNIKYFTVGAYKIAKYIRRNHVEYVVCFGFNSFYILGILKHLMGFRLLVSERGDPTRKRLSIIRKFLFAGSDVSVFQTYGAARFYDKNKKDASFVIPNPVSIPNNVWKNCEGSLNVISVGRIDFEQKRQDLLIEAFRIVVKDIPKAKLIIVGKGYDENRLISMIKDSGLGSAVILKGFKKDVLTEMAKANVFVLTSDFEGIPNALLEAMAFGMPVISTDCSPGGAAMLIQNGENGILVDKGNVNQLADAMILLLNDQSMRIKLGEQARRDMNKYHESSIIEKWKEAIHRLID